MSVVGAAGTGLRQFQRSLPSLAAVLAFVGIWEVAVAITAPPGTTLVGPSVVARTLVDLRGELWRASTVTGTASFGAVAVAVAVGVPLGLASGRHHLAERLIMPVLTIAQAVPKLAIGPLLLIWVGGGLRLAVVIGAVLAVLPIALFTSQSAYRIRQTYGRLSRSLGLSPARTLVLIEFRPMVPALLVSLRVGTALAVAGVVVGEFLGSQEGLGRMAFRATTTADVASCMAALVCLTTLGGLMVVCVVAVEKVQTRLMGGL